MRLSTKGRYGVRLMFDLAMHAGNGPISLKDIAARQEISEKYLSNIIPVLKTAGLIHAVRGAQGGYVLARQTREITLKDILLVLEGPMCLAECVDQPQICSRSSDCLARDIWSDVTGKMLDALGSFTLEAMVEKQKSREAIPSYSI